MIATLLNGFVTALMQALPRLFAVGAPILVLTIAMAALLDARLPGSADRTPA